MADALEKELESYLLGQGIPDLLTDLVEHLCKKRPRNALTEMIEYLQKVVAMNAENQDGITLTTPDLEDEPGVDMRTSDELRRKYSVSVQRRQAVSAEPIVGGLSKAEVPHYPKTDEQMGRLMLALAGNSLFGGLETEEKELLSNAMFSKSFKPGDVIIKQGDIGDHFYVVDEGECDIFIEKAGEEPKKVLTVKDGGFFGELALMYGTPRAATVKAVTNVDLWCLDRNMYRSILMNSMISKRKMYEKFLANVPLLQTLKDYERSIIADAIEIRTFNEGDVIIEEGEAGDDFFIIVEGTVSVSKGGSVLSHLKRADFFGEIALLTDRPRQATITADSYVKCARLDRDAFSRLLGPVEDLLRRNMDTYTKFMLS
eukprot:TRINITY_DN5913_c0_g1_i1.p1 TRINITY_DN5913_c0_g1~~TRINITY_DN5913_c0_g1_i1.p1  ORF type:complete len:372 (-),score=120.62 TRINITY_DN5913_c0_g1_i1:1213-2328(-)